MDANITNSSLRTKHRASLLAMKDSSDRQIQGNLQLRRVTPVMMIYQHVVQTQSLLIQTTPLLEEPSIPHGQGLALPLSFPSNADNTELFLLFF